MHVYLNFAIYQTCLVLWNRQFLLRAMALWFDLFRPSVTYTAHALYRSARGEKRTLVVEYPFKESIRPVYWVSDSIDGFPTHAERSSFALMMGTVVSQVTIVQFLFQPSSACYADLL